MRKYKQHPLGLLGAFVIFCFVLAGIYAPLLASSKPLAVFYNDQLYFPLFRYLFFSGFYTKPLDIFFNLLMFTFPFMLLFVRRPKLLGLVCLIQIVLFTYFAFWGIQDPAIDLALVAKRQKIMTSKQKFSSYEEELTTLNAYAQLNEITNYILRKHQQDLLTKYLGKPPVDSLFARDSTLLNNRLDKQQWLQAESQKVEWIVWPFFRTFHWEDDAGGGQDLNTVLPWNEVTRVNRKDLSAALLFGIRISLVVGFLAVGLSFAIGVPIGAYAGYYGGFFDIITCRLLEIWESMPTFFMLLLVVAILQSKNVFLVIATIGIFGWPPFSRYIRGEFFKQRSLAYVQACNAIGYPDRRIIFTEILPNAIAPLITLLPFAIMGAVTSEAGLSFLGLGEEGSCSWGVLMDEGRSAFPQEAYLLWPPAIMLTVFLIAIALVGDALRDALDPKLR